MPVAEKPIPRSFPGQRALRITARTLHIGAIAVWMGAVVYDGDSGWWPWVAAMTGFVIVANDVFKYGRDYFKYLLSWVILLKLCTLLVAHYWIPLRPFALWASIIIGSLISHAPGKIRHYLVWGS